MGYKIKKVPYKKRNWKLQFVTWKAGISKIRDVPTEEWLTIGFTPKMTVDEAKARMRQINTKVEIKRHEERRQKIAERMKLEEKIITAYLPENDVYDFESKVLLNRLERNKGETLKTSKILSHWRAVKRMLFELKSEPSEWGDSPERFYDYYCAKQISYSYVQKMTRIANLWGKFISKKYGKYFEPLPPPVGHERERIKEAYFDKNEDGLESSPLTPRQLIAAQGKMQTPHWNWLCLSVWFGLRPSEVDRLKLPSGRKSWRIEIQESTPILFVYQSKLTSLSIEKRWKPIPCITGEQRQALKILETSDFRRPLTKILANYFDPNIKLYGGRKGFVDLMLGLNQSLEDISVWLGHQSIERTWKNYKNKQLVKFKQVA